MKSENNHWRILFVSAFIAYCLDVNENISQGDSIRDVFKSNLHQKLSSNYSIQYSFGLDASKQEVNSLLTKQSIG